MSPAKPVNHQIPFSPRKTVSSSWLVSRVGVGDQSMPSRVDSRRKLEREVRIKRVDLQYVVAIACVRVLLDGTIQFDNPWMMRTHERL